MHILVVLQLMEYMIQYMIYCQNQHMQFEISRQIFCPFIRVLYVIMFLDSKFMFSRYNLYS